MARMIKSTRSMTLGAKLSTVFQDATVADHELKIGDVIENLRYVDNEEIVVVSGKITDIKYTMASKLTWNKKNPADTLAKDMTLESITIDASSQYESKIVTVPVKEIVEFEEEKNVARMKYEPFITYEMELSYSDRTTNKVNVCIGDTFDNVKIIDPDNIGTDITGKFKVIGFAYAVANNAINITGIAFENIESGEQVVADFQYILELNEVYSYNITNTTELATTIAKLAAGDSITITGTVDTSNNHPITITQKNIDITINENIVTDGANTSGIRVANGGSVILSGTGKVVNSTPYDKNHGSGVIGVLAGGEIVFNGSGVSAVIAEDTANKGQFGVCVYGDGKVTVNNGEFEAGWYCISGNGSTTNADSVIEINDGTFTSVADYAIYHPQAGKLIINGGTISGASGALAANNGVIEINGGDFSVLGGGATGNWGDGTSGLGDVAINLNAKYGDITCRITGGTFHATAAGTIMIQTGTTHTVDLKISGGKFSSKPEDAWIADGYVCSRKPDADGYYTVTAENA